MQKPDFLILDEQFKLLKLKKKVVETELDMPLNSLSSMLSGKRNIPDKWLILLKKYIESKGGSFELNNDRGNPLTNAARGRDECGINKDELNKSGKDDIKKAPKIKVSELKNNQSPPPEAIRPQMPKGLSLMQQLEWREKNGQ